VEVTLNARMATAGEEPKFPLPITVHPDMKGFVFIDLSVKELAVNKPLFGNPKKAENAEIKADFQKGEVKVAVEVQNKAGETLYYCYHKKLPEDIDPEFCKFLLLADKGKSEVMPKFKPGRIRVELKKAVDVSWVQHQKYLCSKSQ